MCHLKSAALAIAIGLGLSGAGSFAGPSRLELIRCGTDLVRIGDTEYEVLKKCGEPVHKSGNRWTYDFGTGSFLRVVVFERGHVVHFDIGARQ